MSVTAMRCPGCAAPLPPGGQACLYCRLPLTGPTAAELWQVDQALLANEGQRLRLLARRDTLLTLLRSHVPHRPPSPAGTAPRAQPAAVPTPLAPRVRHETSPQSVQNLLLGLGGVLLAVAAVVFTVVAWGRFGLGGRAVILLTFTGIALAAPAILLRRTLSATAETIALIGLVLMALDGYVAYRAGLSGLDELNGFGYGAALLTVIAATAAGYARAVPLRLLTPIAVVVAQPVVPLIAAALQADVAGFALACTIVAGLDVALVAAIRRSQARWPERLLAAIGAAAASSFAIPVASALTFLADNPWRAAGVLALTGAVALFAAALSAPLGRAFLAGCGILLVAGAAVGAALPGLGGAGSIAPALAGLAVALGVSWAPRAWRLGGLTAGAVLLAAGGLAVLVPVMHAVLGPITWLSAAWSGAGGAARTAVDALSGQDAPWSGSPAVLPAVIILAAGVSVVAHAIVGRRGAAAAAVVGTLPAVAVAPVALDLTRSTGLIVQGAIAVALCLLAVLVKRPGLCWPAGAAALSLGALALLGCLAEQTSTLVGLSVAIGVLALSAVVARLPQVGATAAGLLTVTATGLAAAVTLAVGSDGAAASWAMLAVAAIAAACMQIAERRLPHYARAGAFATTASCAVGAVNALAWAPRPGLLLAAAGSIVVGAALRRPRGGEREAFFGVAALPLVGALLGIAVPLIEAYVIPFQWLSAGWGAAPKVARDAVGPGFAWTGDALVPVVLGLIFLAATAVAAALWGRRGAVRLAVPAAAVSCGVLPLAFDLSWRVALITLGVIAATSLTAAALGRAGGLLPPVISGPLAAVLAATTIAWSLASAATTVLALTMTAVVTLLAAVGARSRAVVLVCTAVAASAALLTAVAGAMAAGQPARLAAFAALAVAAALAALAAVLRRDRRAQSWCCEGVAAAGAALAIGLSATSPLTLSIALAVTGLTVGAVALHAQRRLASYVGTALIILGSWVRFADLGITAPEAYTVPVGVVGLVIGWLRWRQQRQLSSWVAFGPGLATALLPSLGALILTPSNAVRPLALGGMAVGIVLAGGWQRMQAPLVLAGGVLIAVTLHELAPWVSATVAALPRWLPLAAAGLLLLAIGATYEQRRRDVRHMRDVFLRMS